MKEAIRFALVALAALATGCASDDEPQATTFGDSVRHTLTLQTASPGTTGSGLDAVKAIAVLDAYRKDQGDRKKIEQQQSIRVQ
jgi:type IV pilus biogenesis protein CpaD/CtpE